MVSRNRPFLIFLLAVAAVLTFYKIPLASSQGLTIVAAEISGALPVDDLDSERWQEATAVEVPLSAQIIARPIFAQANVKLVRTRALFNGEQIAIYVEWEDPSEDGSTVRVQDFSDAVALQFPLVEGQPFFCMGQEGGNVNIWHWKADWQANVYARQDVDTAYPDMYVDGYPFADEEAGAAASITDYRDVNFIPALAAGNLFASAARVSPVEDLIAGTFGSLTSQPAEMQNVQGHGEWSRGKWRVIFTRDLASNEADDIHFEAGKVYAIAFAAWDGANDERNGQKSTSQWVSLQLGKTGTGAAVGAPETASEAQRGGISTIGLVLLVTTAGLYGILVVLGLAGLMLSRRLSKK